MIAEGDVSLAREIVHKIVDSLQVQLVEERNVHAAKNLMRVLAVVVSYGVVASQALSQTLLQILEECNTGAGGKLR